MNAAVLGLVALALVVATTTLWFRAAMAVKLPRNRSAFVAAWAAGLLLGIAALVLGAEGLALAPAIVSIVGSGFLLGLVLISPQQVADDAIAAGETLRDFTALDDQGADFALATTRGTPTLLKFFRGHW